MSIKLMSQVWECDLGSHPQQVLMALADWANDDGGDVRPSLDLVAWRTGLSRATVKRIIRDFRDLGVLIQTRAAAQHRPTEYRMDLSSLAKKPPFRRVSVTPLEIPPDGSNENPGGSKEDSRGVIALTPDPSVFEPSLEPEVQELSASEASNATTQAQLWDAVRTACGWPGRDLLSPAKTRLGKTARILREGGATVEDVSDFAAAYRAAWPGMSLTPEAMVKHWDLWRGGGLRPQIVSKPVTAADRVFGAARAWEARYGSDEGGTVRRDAGGSVPALPDRGADDRALGAGLREARRGDRADRMGGASADEGSER